MIEYVEGNLLEADVDALVNTVNEVGLMGKGIALQFREAFPVSARQYAVAARHGDVRVGHVFVTRDDSLDGPKWIIHFPTKRNWRQPSQLVWVRDGLHDLVRVVREHQIESIALPPLGCGNGGLGWDDVRREIETAFAGVDGVRVMVYEPLVAEQARLC
jgi:O-acetyl-ADP-ribose deacetylase (regulator of RNase III)